MYKIISNKISKLLLDKKIIESEYFEAYEYGFNLLLSTAFTISVIILASFFLNNVFKTIIFLTSFLIIRTFCGGYHAKRQITCFLLTVFTYFLFVLTNYFLEKNSHLTLITFFMMLFSNIIIICFAPVKNQNNPITPTLVEKFRIISVSISVLLILMFIISIKRVSIYSITLPIFIGVFLASVALLIAKFEMHFKRKEDDT